MEFQCTQVAATFYKIHETLSLTPKRGNLQCALSCVDEQKWTVQWKEDQIESQVAGVDPELDLVSVSRPCSLSSLRLSVVLCEVGVMMVPVSEGCYERESGPIVEGIANHSVNALCLLNETF